MQKNIRVAFISYFFGIGGVERTFLSIAENIKCIKFYFISLSSDDFQNRFRECGECFCSKDSIEVVRFLQSEKIDIVQTCNCEDGTYLAFFAGVKRIVERPDGFCTAFLTDKSLVDCVICSTRTVYDRAKQCFPEKNIQLIYNGVDTKKFLPSDNTDLKKKFGFSQKNVVVGYCGRISVEKCLDKLMDIFYRLVDLYPNARLVILGSDHMLDYKKMLIEKAEPIKEKILFLDSVEDPDQVLNLFDIAVLCSGSHSIPGIGLVSEGVPNSVMEEMAVGLPIVATDSGQTSLLVKNNENGYVVGVDDWDAFLEKVAVLVKDKNLRERMGKRSRELIEENFDINHMVAGYEKMYRFLMTDDFLERFPHSRQDDGFSKYRFEWSGEKNLKILVIRSANQSITRYTMSDILSNLQNPQLFVLCHKKNHKAILSENYPVQKYFVYDESDCFEADKMSTIVSEINDLDYIVFMFNNLSGYGYANVKELVSRIKNDNKIVVNSLKQKFLWKKKMPKAGFEPAQA